MIYTVSENTEIILNGKKYLLEAGDKIVLEAISPLEPELKDIAEKLSYKAKKENLISFNDLELIKRNLYHDIENYELFKNFVKNEFKNRGIKYKISEKIMDMFFMFFINYIESGSGLEPEHSKRDPRLKQFDGWRTNQ